MDPEQIRRRYGMITDIIGGGWLSLTPGEITDDTQMTMCVMDAIMRMPKNEDEFIAICKDNFVEWMNSNPKDIGNQCAKAIRHIINEVPLPVDAHALGNGSLMRAMPLAILNLPFYNMLQGRITHNNIVCSRYILEYTRIIQEYLNDNEVYEYLKEIKGLLKPTGHIKNTFNNSVYWSTKESFEKAIIGAVNHGGDADTIAAITGSLAGAKFGYSSIPEKWINQLNFETRKYLEIFKFFTFSCLQI